MKQCEQIHIKKLLMTYPHLDTIYDALLSGFDICVKCFSNDHRLYVCGNGGSAADAEHITGELVKGFLKKRKPERSLQKRLENHCTPEDAGYLMANLQSGLPCFPLTGMPSLATAVTNDIAGDMVFAQQISVFGRPGDVLLAISTSGNARNVYLACCIAQALEMTVIGLTGEKGGTLADMSDICIQVPANETYTVQEYHLPVYHTLCAMLEAHFFEK